MRFTILGSGTTLPDADRGPAGFVVQSDGAAVLVDGGSGTMQRLKRAGVDARELDGGVYSHRHLDHCGDLAPLLFTMKVGIDIPRSRDYPIWAGEGFVDFLEGLRSAYGHWLEGGYQVPVHELTLHGPDSVVLPGGVRLDTLPAQHSAGALHLRFTSPAGSTVVFSGDTGPSDNLVELARGVDVLVCECAVPGPTDYRGHLWPEAVADIADRARPKRLVLTHFYPTVDAGPAIELVRATGVPTERGFDGQVIELD
ncbi:MAG: ribonuclease Z [Proteobacteria bacterium]|nr:ribonuclease Z [Pseudomonadota bacterium]MCP4916983.1 ribonuclease Z [Pseudomonadota bacterium]